MGSSWLGPVGAIAGGIIGGPAGAMIGGAAGSILGGSGNPGSSVDAFSAGNAFNAAEAQKQRDWEQMMYENRHQMEVADLRAAGLNPILSAGGQPPVPSGQSAQAMANPYAQQENPGLQRLQFSLATAKAMSDIDVNKSMAAKNLADASGNVGVPGFLKVPLKAVTDWFSGVTNAKGLNSLLPNLRGMTSALPAGAGVSF